MQFIDEATIHVKAGAGGNGCVAFMDARGGPAGGDGGDGGSIIVVADSHLASLLDFKYRRHYKAKPGEHGRNKDQYGAAAEDLKLRVPVGTVIYEEGTEAPIADLAEDGARFVLAKGGIGGRGNIHFKSPWNQAPRTAEPGTPGQERTVRLELKLLADVGLLGYPNVGKSTFISQVSRARPKIADYPFTTLVPNLGVVRMSGERDFVIADIPGLIEGAAEGAGLGLQFLRHVERCRVLLHIVEGTFTTGPTRSPIEDYRVINAELGRYAPELAKKPQVVVLNKVDATDPDQVAEHRRGFAALGVELLTMSAATGEGTAAVLEALWSHLQRPP
ncbi:MAG: GTP-binding protein Obg/CgtA [Deltaproteobacteria bacterium]|nr:GTP-binding protein Obg/CgtA [Deltaproteobacteria bacterium]